MKQSYFKSRAVHAVFGLAFLWLCGCEGTGVLITDDGIDPCHGLDGARLCIGNMVVVCLNGQEIQREHCDHGCVNGPPAACATWNACESVPDGSYCGDDIGLSGHALVMCVGGQVASTEYCQHGCMDGSCVSVDPCAESPEDGWYCSEVLGADPPGTRYHCMDGTTASKESCDHGCEGGACLPADPCAETTEDEWYCFAAIGQGDSDLLVHCVDGRTAQVEPCEPGCQDGQCLWPEPLDLLPDGIYYFHLKGSGKALNLYASTDERADQDGTNVTVWRHSGHNTQRFRVENQGQGTSLIYAMSSSDGTDRIIHVDRSRSDEVQIGDNIQLGRSTVPEDHQWVIAEASDGHYTIELAHLAGAVMGSSAPDTDGGNVLLQQVTEEDTPLWRAEEVQPSVVVPPVVDRRATSGFIPNRYISSIDHHSAHLAYDYVSTSRNLTIRSFADGEVLVTDYSGGAGYYVRIRHNVNGKRVYSFYCHLVANSFQVNPGDVVQAGQAIGTMGATGTVTGVHLHFAIADTNSFLRLSHLTSYVLNEWYHGDYIVHPQNGVKYYNPERVLETNGEIIH